VSKQRIHKIGEEIKRELSDILRKESKDPRMQAGVISITGVEVSGDLSQAKIFVSIYGKEVDPGGIMEAMRKSSGFLRSELGKRIRIRHIPELIFQQDTSMAYGDHINKLLKGLDLGEQEE
jgi:ribosome-binding factor A